MTEVLVHTPDLYEGRTFTTSTPGSGTCVRPASARSWSGGAPAAEALPEGEFFAEEGGDIERALAFLSR